MPVGPRSACQVAGVQIGCAILNTFKVSGVPDAVASPSYSPAESSRDGVGLN